MRHLAIAPLIRAAGINDDRPAKAFGFHLFEIAGDGLFRDVAIQPPPIGAQAGAGRRIGPAFSNVVSIAVAGATTVVDSQAPAARKK
jgi:hypothetical protein